MDFDKEKMKSLMIDHIDGKITGELAKYVEKHIEKNPSAKADYLKLKEVMKLLEDDKELEPPSESKQRFLAAAAPEMKNPPLITTRRKNHNLSVFLKVAAAVALVAIAYLGNRLINKSKDQIQSLQIELNQSKQVLLASLQNEQSASQRLNAVLNSSSIEEHDEEIIDALISTLNNDGNVNVRIAAAEALAQFSDDQKARAALIASLNQQSNPSVQLRLIDILVYLGDKEASEPLKEFSQKEDIINSVKDEAEMSLFKLM